MGDELFKRVKEATEAAPHFQGSTDAAGMTGADEATWEGPSDEDDALAEELRAIAATLLRVSPTRLRLRRFGQSAHDQRAD